MLKVCNRTQPRFLFLFLGALLIVINRSSTRPYSDDPFSFNFACCHSQKKKMADSKCSVRIVFYSRIVALFIFLIYIFLILVLWNWIGLRLNGMDIVDFNYTLGRLSLPDD